MSPNIVPILLMSLGLGTTMVFASSHWFLAWMGLEINTLAILPLMIKSDHPRATEAAVKYFLSQAAAAALLLFASLTNGWVTGEWNILQLTHPVAAAAMIMALALKLGVAPAHFWLPEVLQGLDLMTGLILSTWQKLAPFALITQLTSTNSQLLIFLGLSSTLVGGWGGLNQTQVRKILAYSSIAHLGWMILVLQLNPSLTILALFTYIIMTSAAFLTFKTTNSTNLKSLATAWSIAPVLAALAPLILLSLGGLPPLTGFAPKWLILMELAKQNLPLTAVIAALSALLSLFFYLRICYAMTLTTSPATSPYDAPWRAFLIVPHTMPLFTLASILMLPLTPALLFILTR
nr:NADH dehydrogenase subunit 2 [Hygophum reinhardtii]